MSCPPLPCDRARPHRPAGPPGAARAPCTRPSFSPPLAAPGGADAPVDFNRDVRPILSDTCFACHGFDAKARKAGLRLDVPEGAFAKRKKAIPIIPGSPDKSSVWQRIVTNDPDEVMPPPSFNKRLTPAQKETLRKWIAQGAKYQKHWSFEPIRRPSVPPIAGARTPIDAFLLERIAKAGLTPQGEADRETLIRRVAFALTGLPPTVAEVDAYLADTAPNAYERMVDRYLASQRYGEEMGRHWLDVARYADTHGLHLDNERQMWAYRDWVIRAFNDNLPYDKFTVWQVAGDLLPNPTTDQLVATGFNRCNVTTSEGGSIDVEFVYRYAVERTTAVTQAWLGLTAGCSICHDHKYDPFSMKEFYSLYAFYNSAGDPAMDGNVNNTPPFLRVLRPEQKAAAEAAGRVEREARAWLDTLAGLTSYSEPAAGSVRKPIRDVLFDDVLPVGANSSCSSRNPTVWETDPAFRAASGRRVIQQSSAVGYSDTLDFKLRPVVVPHDAALEVWLRVDAASVPKSVSLRINGAGGVTWTRTDKGLVRNGSKDAPLVPGVWTKVTLPAADLGLKPGSRIGQLVLSQDGGVAWWDRCVLIGNADPAVDPLGSLTAWRKAVGTAVPPEVPGELHGLIAGGPGKALSADEALRLRKFYLAVVARPVSGELEAARAAWEAARTARIVAEESAPGTFIYREMGTPRDSFVMLRGQYDKPGEKVQPGGLSVLPPIKSAKPGARLTRLDLANWLVESDNPLTARVTVNRLWQQFFGIGLVKTSYDFGSQGEVPSHPELLDWLAADFRDTGWDVKRFVKMLVTSDAFRRKAVQTPEVRAKDPQNRLYARGPRFRLDAEQIRDNVLFVSGLINPKMGGRGVNIYQPPNIWEPVGYADSNTRFYLQDHGPALYRRSIYVFLKRTAPPPFMSTFDAPNREQVCTVRERSNTPLQALQLMNDVQHFEAARALAERALAEGGATTPERLTFLVRTVLARRPDADEVRLLSAALERQRELFRADPEAAKKAVHVGESIPRAVAPEAETASWAMIANLIFNLDETVNRN
ncbi:MAG: DUF1553 domain-containing protein [Gemmataceae bacterium]